MIGVVFGRVFRRVCIIAYDHGVWVEGSVCRGR